MPEPPRPNPNEPPKPLGQPAPAQVRWAAEGEAEPTQAQLSEILAYILEREGWERQEDKIDQAVKYGLR